jgi:hypothetical protein
MIKIKQFTSKDQFWIDEKGIQIPFNRTSALERTKEVAAHRIFKEAKKINEQLSEFKKFIEDKCRELYKKELESAGADEKERKGNYVWYSFDKKIKIEININENISFKTVEIQVAKEKLDSFISENLSGVDQLIKELVNDAFQNTKGGLDPKKVLSLLKYRHKIKAAKFQEALDLIEKSIERNSSKTYYRVWEKQITGEYKNIDLNFSTV